MAKDELKSMYEKFATAFMGEIASNDFYAYFINMMQSKPQDMTVYEKYVERQIDMRWVEAIEKAVVPLDSIIRNPNRYIRRDEDIVRIELARDVGPEAVRHLAQHTNMIASVENDTVTPERILNITKEEALDTYENRFIFTLLRQVEYFVDRRLSVLNEKSKLSDRFEYKLEGTCEAGNDDLDYSFVMNFTTPHAELESEDLLAMDTTRLTSMERVERIRKIVYTFRYTPFMKNLAGCAPVRPPLTMTNVLTKNQDFIKAVELWNFISMYDDVGFSMDFVDRQVTPGDKALKELYSVVMIQYMLLKQYTHREVDIGDIDERRQKMAPNIIKRNIENIINSYDLTVDEVRRIFEDEIKKKEKKRDAIFNKARSIIGRAIEAEEEIARLEQQKIKEREERERKRLEAIRIAEEKRLERERLAEERRLEKERKAREREEERLRKQAERAEQARLAAEAREKARLEREEKKRLAEEAREQARIERERLAAERAEQARIKAEQRAAEAAARKVEQERLAVERAEKARLAAEERARKEAERIEKAARAAEERRRKEEERAERARIAAEEKARKDAEKAAAEAEAARKREEARLEAERIAEERAREAEELRKKLEALKAEQERLEALYAPYKAEEDRIAEGLDKAKQLPRKKKKAAKKQLQKDKETVDKAMPDEVKEYKKKSTSKKKSDSDKK